MEENTVKEPTQEAAWQVGLRGARANLVPGIALWVLALSIVGAYYLWPAASGFFKALGDFRTQYGFAFSITSMAIFAGLIPFLVLKIQKATTAQYPWPHLWFYLGFWGFKGADIDLWYRFLNWAMGDGTSVGMLAAKTLIDQLIFTTIYALPLTVVAYAWREEGFSFKRLRERRLKSGFYRREVVPVLIANWGVWIPTLFAVYSLPLPLQLPMVNIAMCFFTLLLAHVAARQAKKAERTP